MYQAQAGMRTTNINIISNERSKNGQIDES